MHHHAQRVHAGVGSAGGNGTHRAVAHASQGRLQGPLDPEGIGLALPTVEAGPVELQEQSPATGDGLPRVHPATPITSRRPDQPRAPAISQASAGPGRPRGRTSPARRR